MFCSWDSCHLLLPAKFIACPCKKLSFCSKNCYFLAYPTHKKECKARGIKINFRILLNIEFLFVLAQTSQSKFNPPCKPKPMALNDHDHTNLTTTYKKVPLEDIDKAIKHALAKENCASQSQPASVSPQSQLASLPPEPQSAVLPLRSEHDSLPPITQSTSLNPQSQPGSDPFQSDSMPPSSSGFRSNVKRDRYGRFKGQPELKNHPKTDTQIAADKVASNVAKWKQAAVKNMRKIQKARFCDYSNLVNFNSYHVLDQKCLSIIPSNQIRWEDLRIVLFTRPREFQCRFKMSLSIEIVRVVMSH